MVCTTLAILCLQAPVLVPPATPHEPRLELAARRRGKRPPRSRPALPPKEEKAPAPPDLPTAHRAIGLLPFELQGVAPQVAQTIEAALLAEMDAWPNTVGVAPQDVQHDAAGFNLEPAACEGDAACLAKVGRYARTHWVIQVRLASLAGTLSVVMRLIDSQTGKELGRVGDPLSDEPERRTHELHTLIAQLIAPDTYTGSLLVKTSVAGAAVYIDDTFAGTTPLAQPIEGLRAGPHVLRVSKAGFRDIYQFVDVVYKRNATLEVDLATNTITGNIVREASQVGYGQLYLATDLADVEIRIDGEPRGATPMGEPMGELAAGKRVVSLRHGTGEPVLREVDIQPNRRTDLQIEDTPQGLRVTVLDTVAVGAPLPGAEVTAQLPPSEELVTQPAGPGWQLITGAVAGGVGLGGVAAGVVLSMQVRAKNEEAAALSRTTLGFREQVQAHAAEVQALGDPGQLETAQWICYGVGGGLLAAGLGLIIWHLVAADAVPDTTVDTQPLTLWPTVLPHGASASVLWRW